MKVDDLRTRLAKHDIHIGRRAIINALRDGRIKGNLIPDFMTRTKGTGIWDVPEEEVDRIVTFMKHTEKESTNVDRNSEHVNP